ncbi:MAG: tetratricopeptide repeat protein [Parasulfuritortus sp.]|jgi:tetratricopeptide (TPR) repeat protein|nr:tetratricopeptide repeat protein [Parasulfuritortus sp.]
MLSKVANLVVWTVLALFVVFLVYRYTDWIKPAADHAVSQVKSVIGKAVPNGPFGKGASEDQLNLARDSYAKGDVDASVAAYREYIKKNPSNADAHGELGNVYYTAGNLPEAAQSYYDAANLLIDQKQLDRVNDLMPVIGQINPSLANDLGSKMAQAASQEQQPGVEQQSAAGQPQQPASPQSALHYY